MKDIELRQIKNVRNNLVTRIRELEEKYENERALPESQWCHRYLGELTVTLARLNEQVVLITEIIDNNADKQSQKGF